MLNTFTYNGHSSDEFGIRIEKMPPLNRSARKFQAASVRGCNGNIYELEDAWEETIQPYQIFAGSRTQGAAVSSFTTIMEWLHSANDYVVLSDTYDTEHYRKAIFVDSVDIESAWHTFGRATINFRCRPEHYIVAEPWEAESGDLIPNETNHTAYPLITLTGGGARSQINLTNKALASATGDYTSLSAIVPYKDTAVWSATGIGANKIRLFDTTSYTSNISNANGSIQLTTPNTGGTGRGIGLLQSVQADSDYTLSLDMYVVDAVYDEEEETSVVAIYFVGATGNNNIIGYKYVVDDESYGWKHMRLTFHTPAECGYIFVIIQNPYTLDRTIQAKNIMLNGGETQRTFRPYDDSSVSRIQINGTILEFTANGYDEAVIDCDKEDVQIDNVNGNPVTTVTDQYGNLSADFLRLEKGSNVVTYGEDVAGATLDLRLWEL